MSVHSSLSVFLSTVEQPEENQGWITNVVQTIRLKDQKVTFWFLFFVFFTEFNTNATQRGKDLNSKMLDPLQRPETTQEDVLRGSL